MTSTGVTRLYGSAVIAVLAVVSYLSFTQPMPTQRPTEQAALYAEVPKALDPHGAPPVAAPAKGDGEALAYIRIPRFGHNWLWTVVEGTSLDDLAKGPGHYTGTPLMGARGNSVYAAHRATHGDPFIDFDQLRVGDTVRFEQSGAWWVYQITRGPRIVLPSATWLLRQTAGQRHRLTLTTCWPRYGSAKRMFVRGVLVDWSSKRR